MKLLVKEKNRTIALVSETHSLLFKAVEHNKVAVEITPNTSLEKRKYRPLLQKDCYGFIGLIGIAGSVFLAIITGKTESSRPLPYESLNKIYSVDFVCIDRNDWDFVQLDNSGYPIVAPGEDQTQRIAHPCYELRKLLSNGSFYYSGDFDTTSSLQDRGVSGGKTEGVSLRSDSASTEFMWNCFMMEDMFQYRDNLDETAKGVMDENKFLTSVIRGFSETLNTKFNGYRATITIISRQSWKRAGTRFNVRGIDDDGYVANFVETEIIIYCERFIYAFCQLRGSVPIFWEQDTTLMNPKVTVTRSLEATHPVFEEHFNRIIANYGPIHIVNLLSTKPAELQLSKRYKEHFLRYNKNNNDVLLTEFDFHVETARNGFGDAKKIMAQLRESLYEFGYYSYDPINNKTLSKQDGVFRTNCLDCLDRTNLVQQVVSTSALELLFEDHNINPSYEHVLLNLHNTLFANSGDNISQIYTGTNALKSSFSRSGKSSLAGQLSDLSKSLTRVYVNNFVDKSTQITIDTLLGKSDLGVAVAIYDPIRDYVSDQLNRLESSFTSHETTTIFVGSYNVNACSKVSDLTNWLFPPENDVSPDLYVIGLQEIIELTAGNILNNDPAKGRFWTETIEKQLNSNGEYHLLRSEIISSMMILFFVKSDKLPRIKNVSGASKKTGLGGMTANKGACAVRFNYGDTSFVMITSHLAAGNTATIERYNDYQTIVNGLSFQRNLKVKDHENIIWFGDLNYRINLPNEQARYLVDSGAFDELIQYDQLTDEISNGGAFKGFKEGTIKFMPTYKFDRGTDIYDSSEKQRVPSWTDRVLYIGEGLNQLNYFSVMQSYISDHKPVYSTFKAKVKIINQEVRSKLEQELYYKYKDTHDQSSVSLLDFNTEDDDVEEVSSNDSKPMLPTRPSTSSYINGASPRRIPPPPVSRKEPTPPRLPPRSGEIPSLVAPMVPPPRRANPANDTQIQLTSSPIPIGYNPTLLVPKKSNSVPNTKPNTPTPPQSRAASTMGFVSPPIVETPPTKLAPLVPKKPLNLVSKNEPVEIPSSIPISTPAPIAPPPRKSNIPEQSGPSLSEWKPLTPK